MVVWVTGFSFCYTFTIDVMFQVPVLGVLLGSLLAEALDSQCVMALHQLLRSRKMTVAAEPSTQCQVSSLQLHSLQHFLWRKLL